MIEIINNCFGSFLIALVIYAFFSKRQWVDFAVLGLTPLYLIYLIGFKLGTGDLSAAIIPFVVLLAYIGTIIWKIKNAPEDPQELRSYTRDELITAKKIYDQNYLADPEGFEETKGTYEDAQVTIDYLLGIIDADSEKFKKIRYESKLQPAES
ncbi:hypothetical protein JM79_2732 [Gramella sp. Hel_I_59]|uniref:hypothetical protein n=1 Tax=Gramella sp. Hel_I_59 TaxID=1249978 RepID=UPI0011513291|nr:hypothetical protein [Gramella sp. Hel_I_59]TQI71784.1 hypothetical protein JM79_2732 [Gramella sp. Hel_I_59]